MLSSNLDRHQPVPRFASVGPPFLIKTRHSGRGCARRVQHALRQARLGTGNLVFVVVDFDASDEQSEIPLSKAYVVAAEALPDRTRKVCYVALGEEESWNLLLAFECRGETHALFSFMFKLGKRPVRNLGPFTIRGGVRVGRRASSWHCMV